jgi:hypothetical protein
MVVARPTVTPVVTLAGKSTPAPVGARTMRPSAPDAGGAGAVGAAMRELLRNGVLGGYLGSPPTIKRAPGGATARR